MVPGDPQSAETPLAQAARKDERYLWGLCYRMTGSAADAEDLVQETFARALERPPLRADEPLRPWLTSVAVNLAKDLLRRRRRTPYVGPWLPSPIETADEPPSVEPMLPDGTSTEGRYDMLESVSLAFLLALEALSPLQRAVLLLRDVFDYSVREVADCLGLSEPNVKTTHHRARKAMEAYDRERCVPTRALQGRTREMLEQLMGCLLTRDTAGAEALLSRSARFLADGGGEFLASRVPVLGPKRVVLLIMRLTELRGPPEHAELRMVNGLPALIATYARSGSHSGSRVASRVVIAPRLDTEGRILDLYNMLATAKLTAMRF
jgi:RNA polymerase sigma factor (sigma-70 family)